MMIWRTARAMELSASKCFLARKPLQTGGYYTVRTPGLSPVGAVQRARTRYNSAGALVWVPTDLGTRPATSGVRPTIETAESIRDEGRGQGKANTLKTSVARVKR